jgi:hypothetical protein
MIYYTLCCLINRIVYLSITIAETTTIYLPNQKNLLNNIHTTGDDTHIIDESAHRFCVIARSTTTDSSSSSSTEPK